VIPTTLVDRPSDPTAPQANESAAPESAVTRSPAPPVLPVAPAARTSSRWRDADVLIAMGVIWIVSVVRVAGAAVHREVFGAEATLAFLSMFVIPWLVVRSRLPAEPRNPRSHLRLVGGTSVARRLSR
jgi:hypothetical protein